MDFERLPVLKRTKHSVFGRYDIMTVGETGNLKSDIALDYVLNLTHNYNM